MNILDKIISHKRIEVEKQKIIFPVQQLEKRQLYQRECLSLKHSLSKENNTGIIAEFKRRSPSKGMIHEGADVEAITRGYVRHGAAALSVLTDSNFFGGAERDLLQARINEVPILRKDFIIDEYQVIETKAMGADIMLLIASCLTKEEVRRLATLAKHTGLEVLLELHTEEEMQHICDEVDFVGINNRDLKTFKVDIERSIKMRNQIRGEKPLIAESGITNGDTIFQLRSNGFSGFLIGETFMKEKDPVVAFRQFVDSIPKK